MLMMRKVLPIWQGVFFSLVPYSLSSPQKTRSHSRSAHRIFLCMSTKLSPYMHHLIQRPSLTVLWLMMHLNKLSQAPLYVKESAVKEIWSESQCYFKFRSCPARWLGSWRNNSRYFPYFQSNFWGKLVWQWFQFEGECQCWYISS